MIRVLAMLLALLLPGVAAAQDAAGHDLFRQGRYADAATLFEDPAWKGVAYYRALQLIEAAEMFAQGRDVWSLYNLATTYARMSLFADALKAYEAVLLLEPEHEDARANAALMREILTVEKRPDRPSESGLSGFANEGGKLDVEDAEGAAGDDRSGEAERDQGGTADDAEAADGDGAQARSREAAGDGTGAATDGGESPENLQRAGGREKSEVRRYREEDVLMSPGPGFVAERQADVAWLEAIREDPGEFLKRRLALERWRRRVQGRPAVPAGDPW